MDSDAGTHAAHSRHGVTLQSMEHAASSASAGHFLPLLDGWLVISRMRTMDSDAGTHAAHSRHGVTSQPGAFDPAIKGVSYLCRCPEQNTTH